jgi:GT2 family glycosyltransferase
MWISVGIATNGRGPILQEAIRYIGRQTRLPNELIICSAIGAETGPIPSVDVPFPIHFIQSELGLTKQRNAILRKANRSDVLLFLDDDFFLCDTYIAEMEKIFEDVTVVVATGTVVADGIKGPGISPDDAGRMIRRENAARPPSGLRRIRQGYGCNMALRYRPMVAHGLTFDENLPRYGWYEDVDLMRRLAVHGQVVRSAAARGVHLGTKAGRTSGRFLGYSQVANPIYLHEKGIYDLHEAFISIAKNFAANIARSLYPESYIDRRGRLLGNLAGLRDLATRKLHPLNALRMDAVEPRRSSPQEAQSARDKGFM